MAKSAIPLLPFVLVEKIHARLNKKNAYEQNCMNNYGNFCTKANEICVTNWGSNCTAAN